MPGVTVLEVLPDTLTEAVPLMLLLAALMVALVAVLGAV